MGQHTCDYKLVHQLRHEMRIRNMYEYLVKKDCPPIDTIHYDGKTGNPYPKNFRVPLTNGTLKLWRHGRPNDFVDHTNQNIVGIMISVVPYTKMNHAISAVKYNKRLYCFNSWGIDQKPIDTIIFQNLAIAYKCTKIIIYSGKSLQKNDPHGVCVGFSSNFIIELLLRIEQNNLPYNVDMQLYNSFVYRALTSRGICFGRQCVKSNSIRYTQSKIQKNLASKQNLPTEHINLSSMKVVQLKKLAKLHRVPKYYKLVKENLVRSLQNDLKVIEKSNLVNIRIPVKPLNMMTVAQLKKYASNKKLKGRSKFTRKNNLIKFVQSHSELP